MTRRRTILTAAELALTTSALSAAVYGLVHAAYDPAAPVAWVPVAIVGAVTALAFVGLAATLAVGHAALLLGGDAVRELRRRRAAPPSTRPRPGTGSRPAAPGDGRHARAMAAVAAQPTHDGHTVPMPVVTVVAVRDWAGVTR